MTHQRAPASGHRTFNVGFPAMNPKGRSSQPDPQRSDATRLEVARWLACYWARLCPPEAAGTAELRPGGKALRALHV